MTYLPWSPVSFSFFLSFSKKIYLWSTKPYSNKTTTTHQWRLLNYGYVLKCLCSLVLFIPEEGSWETRVKSSTCINSGENGVLRGFRHPAESPDSCLHFLLRDFPEDKLEGSSADFWMLAELLISASFFFWLWGLGDISWINNKKLILLLHFLHCSSCILFFDFFF